MYSGSDCPCCHNSSGNRPLYKLRYGEIRLCARCRTAYTVFDGTDIKSANEVFGSRDYIKARIYELHSLRRIARKRLRLLRAHVTSGHLLEFGASTGEFLYECSKLGLGVSCVDKHPALLDINEPSRVVEVYRQDADSFEIKKTFDAVVAFHVIEHLTRPDEFLRKCRNLLKLDGILFLEAPNFGSLARRVWQRKWGMFYDYHLCHFDRYSLARLLEQSGYRILAVKTIDDPLRYVAPLYNPIRNIVWTLIKKILRRFTMRQPYQETNNSSLTLRDECHIHISGKARIYRLELNVIHTLSTAFLPFSLLLGWLGLGSYLQVIAQKSLTAGLKEGGAPHPN